MAVGLGTFFNFRPKGYSCDLGADFSLSPWQTGVLCLHLVNWKFGQNGEEGRVSDGSIITDFTA